MAERIRAHDWAATALGATESWPDRLKAIVEMVLASPLVSSVALTEKRLLLYNDAAARLYGTRHPAALGRPLAEAFPDSYPDVASLYDRVFAGESIQMTAQPLSVGTDDADEVFDACLSPVRDGAGGIIGAHMVGLEIGERLRADRALRESEERFRAFVTASSDVIYRMSPDWTEMRELDGRGFLANTSRPSADWMETYIHPDDRPGVQATIDGAIRTKTTFELEHRVRRADGTLGWTLSRAVPILDAGGTIREWLGAATNVSSHVEAAQALRESEALRRVALEGGRMGTWRWDLDRRLIWGDPQFLALWGIPPSHEPHALSLFTDRMSSKGAIEMEEIVTRAVDAGEEFDGQLAIVSGPAAGRWIRWRGRASDQASVLYGVSFDITEQREAEAALRESEAKYRTLFENMTEGYAVGELLRDSTGRAVDWRFIEFNPALERHTGMDREASTGRWVSELFPGADRTYWLEVYQAVVDTQTTRTFESYWPPLDRWLGGVASPAGEGRFYIMYRDVSEQKRLELSLRESGERLRQFGEASQDVLWIRDATTFQWEYLTPAFETIYGLNRDAALRGDNMANWLDLILPEDRERGATSLARVRDGEWVTFEYRIRRPVDGEVRWLRNTDFPIRDEAGDVVRIGGIGHDITELKRIEEALAAAGARQRALLEGMPQLVWRAAEGGEWTWASPQWTQYSGQAEPESHGWGWLTPLHPDDRDTARDAWADAGRRGQMSAEYRVRQEPGGQYRWFHSRASAVRDKAGDIVEWLGTSTDIDDLREMQERQKVLVAELQHRTRNLLGVIRSMSEKTVRASADLPDFRGRFRDRLDALARVQGLLSRLTEHDRVTFDELIATELAALDGNAERVTIAGPQGVRIRSSMVQTLAMALHELATNAIKYGALGQPGGRLAVTWKLEPAGRDDRPWLSIDWRESGVAMPPAGSRSRGGGQGRELIERALPYQLSAQTTYDLGPDGVHCTISIPISNTIAPPESQDA